MKYVRFKPTLRAMGAFYHCLSLSLYTLLSYFYFVDVRLEVCAVVWLLMLATFYLVKVLRAQIILLSIIGLTLAFLEVFKSLIPLIRWPLDFYLAAALGFLLLRFLFRQKTENLRWSFRFTRYELTSIAIINIPAVAILSWYFSENIEVAKMFPFPDVPGWAMPLVVVGIAAVNGLREEIYYRGLIQTNTPKSSPAWYVISLQGILFGFLHYANAFPQGWIGVGLTAIWGAAIAIQYRLFKSIALSWVTHSIADAVMFTIIIYAAR